MNLTTLGCYILSFIHSSCEFKDLYVKVTFHEQNRLINLKIYQAFRQPSLSFIIKQDINMRAGSKKKTTEVAQIRHSSSDLPAVWCSFFSVKRVLRSLLSPTSTQQTARLQTWTTDSLKSLKRLAISSLILFLHCKQKNKIGPFCLKFFAWVRHRPRESHGWELPWLSGSVPEELVSESESSSLWSSSARLFSRIRLWVALRRASRPW